MPRPLRRFRARWSTPQALDLKAHVRRVRRGSQGPRMYVQHDSGGRAAKERTIIATRLGDAVARCGRMLEVKSEHNGGLRGIITGPAFGTRWLDWRRSGHLPKAFACAQYPRSPGLAENAARDIALDDG